MEHEIRWFEHDGQWLVVFDVNTESFDDRGAAFKRAAVLAREHTPSVLVNEAPPTGIEAVARRVGAARPQTCSAGEPGATQLPSSTTAAPIDWTVLAGPEVLGRSILLPLGHAAPAPWSTSERVRLDAGALTGTTVLAGVRAAFLDRVRTVYELDASLSAPVEGSVTGDVWRTGVDHDFIAESIWRLATANAVDARDPANPAWRLSTAAITLGARHPGDVDADIILPGGQPAWCDGGPLTLWGGTDCAGLDHAVVPAVALELGLLRPTATDLPTADLAEDQLAAVGESTTRSRIIAPAGSGKTRVLTERARHLVRCAVPVESILVVAFNKRAQGEIRERTADLPGLQVQTLNATALAVVNGTSGYAPQGSRRSTINEIEVRRLLDSMVKFPRRANTDPQAAWIDALSAVRLGLRDPSKVEEEFNGDVDGFAAFFPRYRAELRRLGHVDFDEQIYLALEVLLESPSARLQAQRQARVLLVDEFQDLSPAHMLLIRLLAGPELSVFGVGDDDQTIYGYSGADPEWLVNFDHYIASSTHHALTVNYRCPAPVTDAATNLLSHNRFRVAKEVHPGPSAVVDPDSLHVIRDASPARATVATVRRLLDEGVAPAQIAVLTRVNTLLAPVQAGLVEEGVPIVHTDGLRFMERAGVAAALAWLRIAVDPGHLRPNDVLRAARRPSRGISPRVVEWMSEQRDVAGLTRLGARITDERAADKVAAFTRDVARIGALGATAPADQVLEFVRSELGLDRSMQALDAAHRGRNSAAHSDDLRALIALGQLHPDAATLTSWLADVLGPRDVEDGVTLATVHKVKGLEWPHVVVLDATDGIFPHRLSTDVEEERRIFHVALTRCQQSVTIVADADAPSLFLDELGEPALPAASIPPTGEGRRRADVPAAQGVPEIPAAVGLSFSWGGYDCTVASLDATGAFVAVGSATTAIAFGSQITLDGTVAALVAPSAKGLKASAAEIAGADTGLFDSLKAWRLERARADKVPPYVIAHDSTLAAIAAARPGTEIDLLGVRGMGSKRVEAYGDEILGIVQGS